MTLTQLRYIVKVAEKGSMNEAAKALFISQPSLTNAIQELEKEMNITIFLRTNKGVVLSLEGDQFLGYARQVLEQSNLLEEKYKKRRDIRQRFSVSAQHYSFVVNAFVDVVRNYGGQEYDFILRETQTNEIIEDVANIRSEIGVIYISETNATVMKKLIAQNKLRFSPLLYAKPHVFISATHPLAEKKQIVLDDLIEYPYLSFEQGEYNSFYFSEEILSTLDRAKNIKVRDRATLFNLCIGLNGYTISSVIIDTNLNGENIIARPLLIDETIEIGVLTQKNLSLSMLGKAYLAELEKYVQNLL